jgi:menaquinone-specific isochorismate synthase
MTAAAVFDSGLRAVTRIVDDGNDALVADLAPDGFAWLQDGIGFVTAGVAAHVDPYEASNLLATIEHDDDVGLPGTGPVAVGAVPFDAASASALVVPRRVAGRLPDGRRWVTQLGPISHVERTRVAGPTRFTVDERPPYDEWRTMVQDALGVIATGELEKVVLARAVDVTADRPFDVRGLVARLEGGEPGCFVYACDGMVGATPELLVRRRGDHVESRPMAGTVIGNDDAALARLDGSEKDMRVHQPVPRAIADALAPWCTTLDVPEAPVVVRLASVAHLVSPVEGRLRSPEPDAWTLVAALHPTPAVGGSPRDLALRTLAALEPAPRGRYAGPVGWVDARGDGDWGVALRGASVEGARARLHAGAGIVAGSDPDAEWQETEAKLQPMLRALGVRSERVGGVFV